MATTSNFGWTTPDDTDLVKDGALAIRTLGNNIDSSLVDLKGGTTGQVLSKNSNTDLDYTWVTPNDADAIQNTIVDAKGDLISATAADTPARLGVGANGETLVADSSTTTGLRWQGQFMAGKNAIINGDFRIWQRGTSFSATGYTADRWYFDRGNTTTLTQQSFTVGTAPVAGYESPFFLRMARTAGTNNDYLIQRIEDVRTFANQTITVSFWAKADSATTIAECYVEQNFGSGGSAGVGTGNFSGISITQSWTRYSVTISVPSISGKTLGAGNFLGLTFKLGTGIGNRTIDFWGVQVEAGSVATPFTTATGTLAGELAACQRYYYLLADGATLLGPGAYISSTRVDGYALFKVTMRIAPTLIQTSGTNYYKILANNTDDGFNDFLTGTVTTDAVQLYQTSNVSGTAGWAGILFSNNAASRLAFSAEL